MTKQELLKTKIELVLRMSEVVGMHLMKGDLEKSEEDRLIKMYINDLYDYISQLEPKHEGEVL